MKLPWVISNREIQANFDELVKRVPTPVSATLPAQPFDGQEFAFRLSGGGVWYFKYNAATGFWDFMGGPPLYSEVAVAQATASLTYVALATAGPSIALPFAGDYDVDMGNRSFNSAGSQCLMSYDIGGTDAVDADAVFTTEGAGARNWMGMRRRRKTGLTVVTLTAKYRATGGTANFDHRWMSVLPVRVS